MRGFWSNGRFFKEKMRDFRVKWGIFKEKMHGFWLSEGFSIRNCVIFWLNLRPGGAGRCSPGALTEHGARNQLRGGAGTNAEPPQNLLEAPGAGSAAKAALRPAYRPPRPISSRAAGRAASRKRSALSSSAEARGGGPGGTARARNARGALSARGAHCACSEGGGGGTVERCRGGGGGRAVGRSAPRAARWGRVVPRGNPVSPTAPRNRQRSPTFCSPSPPTCLLVLDLTAGRHRRAGSPQPHPGKDLPFGVLP